jgi:hypothetical protein
MTESVKESSALSVPDVKYTEKQIADRILHRILRGLTKAFSLPAKMQKKTVKDNSSQ